MKASCFLIIVMIGRFLTMALSRSVKIQTTCAIQGCTETGNMQTDWHLLLQALFTLFDKLKTWVLRVDNQGELLPLMYSTQWALDFHLVHQKHLPWTINNACCNCSAYIGTISSGNNSGKRAAISSGHFSEGKACVEKMLQEVDHRVLAKASYRCLPVQKGHALIVSSISTKNPRSGFKVWSVRTGDAIL